MIGPLEEKIKVLFIGFLKNPFVITIIAIGSILYVFNAFYLFYDNSKNIWLSYEFWSQGEKSSSIILRNLGLLIFAILGFIVAIYRGVLAFKNTKIAQATQTTNAFTSALEQLSNKNIHIRIGAIHACGQIAKNNVKAYKSIVSHTLKSYLKDNSIYEYQNIDPQNPDRDKTPIKEDIVAAMRYLAYNNIEQLELGYTNLALAWLPKAKIINGNLSFSNMSFANLDGANLSGTRLHKTYFYQTGLYAARLKCPYIRRAKFITADLRNANFDKSIVFKSDFNNCKLEKSRFKGARINRCYFYNSNLTGADFRGATFRGTIFTGTILDNADFRGVKNVPTKQLSGARSTKGIRLDADAERDFFKFRRLFKVQVEGENDNAKRKGLNSNPYDQLNNVESEAWALGWNRAESRKNHLIDEKARNERNKSAAKQSLTKNISEIELAKVELESSLNDSGIYHCKNSSGSTKFIYSFDQNKLEEELKRIHALANSLNRLADGLEFPKR